MKKLLFIILLLILPFKVYATDGIVNGSIYSSDISSSGQAQFYDVNHNSITTTLIQQPTYSPYFQSPARDTSYLSLNVYTNFQTNVLYSLTIYVNNNSNSNVDTWNNNIATSTYLGGANSNNSNATCRVNVYSVTSSYNIKYYININSDGTSDVLTGAYYLTFSPTCSGSYINIPVAFGDTGDYMYYYGYHLETIGLTDGLTSQEVQSIVTNSGLATANSVNQVQQSITQVQQDIISSSGSIVNNQNENTQKQIDSQKVCSTIDKSNIKSDNKYLNSSGSLVSLNSTGVTDYIKVNSNSELKTINNFSGGSSISYCFYNINKEIISCSLESSLVVNNNITIPSNAEYVRFSIIKSSNLPSFQLCNNGNQALHDSLNDDTLDNSSIDNTFDTLGTLEGTSITPLTDFVTIPLTWVQSLLTPSESCSTINLPLPFLNNKTLDLPCMNTFWNRMGVLATLVQLVWVAVVCVRVFNGLFLLVCDVKDPNPDKDMTKLRTWEL